MCPLLLLTCFRIKRCSNCVHCLSPPFAQQATIVISALGVMTALWTKSEGKIALRVVSESAIKLEWCSEVQCGLGFLFVRDCGRVAPSHNVKSWLASTSVKSAKISRTNSIELDPFVSRDIKLLFQMQVWAILPLKVWICLVQKERHRRSVCVCVCYEHKLCSLSSNLTRPCIHVAGRKLKRFGALKALGMAPSLMFQSHLAMSSDNQALNSMSCIPGIREVQFSQQIINILENIEPEVVYSGFDNSQPEVAHLLLNSLNRLCEKQLLWIVKWSKSLPGNGSLQLRVTTVVAMGTSCQASLKVSALKNTDWEERSCNDTNTGYERSYCKLCEII